MIPLYPCGRRRYHLGVWINAFKRHNRSFIPAPDGRVLKSNVPRK